MASRVRDKLTGAWLQRSWPRTANLVDGPWQWGDNGQEAYRFLNRITAKRTLRQMGVDVNSVFIH